MGPLLNLATRALDRAILFDSKVTEGLEPTEKAIVVLRSDLLEAAQVTEHELQYRGEQIPDGWREEDGTGKLDRLESDEPIGEDDIEWLSDMAQNNYNTVYKLENPQEASP